MSIDPSQILLDDVQRRTLAELSDQTGKPWPVVFAEALASYRPKVATSQARDQDSFSQAAERLGLVGCVEGPADLSTNPAYMEGFGEREE